MPKWASPQIAVFACTRVGSSAFETEGLPGGADGLEEFAVAHGLSAIHANEAATAPYSTIITQTGSDQLPVVAKT